MLSKIVSIPTTSKNHCGDLCPEYRLKRAKNQDTNTKIIWIVGNVGTIHSNKGERP